MDLMECLEPERHLSGNAMENIMDFLELERHLSRNAMENIMDFFGARAVVEQKCNGKYNGIFWSMSGV